MTATAQDQPALDPLTPNHLAWCLTAAGGSYEWVEVAGQPLGPTDVAIRPRSSALNHMDLWLTRGKPSPPSYPHVAGGDGAGIVIEIGAEVSTVAVGDEVIIDPSIVSADAAQRGYDAPLDRSYRFWASTDGEPMVGVSWCPLATSFGAQPTAHGPNAPRCPWLR